MVSPARFAASILISNTIFVIFFFEIDHAPSLSKASISLTVRTPCRSTSLRIVGSWLSSEELIEENVAVSRRLVHPWKSPRDDRFTMYGLASINLSKAAPNGSLPSTPITNGSSCFRNACAGHSVNLIKIVEKRSLDFILGRAGQFRCDRDCTLPVDPGGDDCQGCAENSDRPLPCHLKRGEGSART